MIKIFILLLLSFCFSGIETAMTAISLPLLVERAGKGDKKAKILLKIKKNPDKLLGTLLLGNNLVNIALTALSTSLLIEAFGPARGVAIATIAVSFFVLVFAEILPKTYAMRQTIPFAFFFAYPLHFLILILGPLVGCLNQISRLVLKILPEKKSDKPAEELVKEELRGTISMTEKGLAQERGMLGGILDLSETTIGDIFTDRSRLSSLNIDTPIPEMLAFLRKSPYSRIPLWQTRRDNIVGVLHIKKAMKLADAWRHNTSVSVLDYCSKPWFVLNSVSLLDQLSAFRKRREHFAIVVNEYGDIQGIITLEDLLEEIVGDIADETDDPNQASLSWRVLADGTYRINGNATLRDINRAFHWHLPDENAITLAGYVMYSAEQIPHVGQQFNLGGFLFTVHKKRGHKITQIDVLPPEES